MEENPEDNNSDIELEDIYVPDPDVLQQIDAGEILTEDDLSDYMDEVLIQDIGGLF